MTVIGGNRRRPTPVVAAASPIKIVRGQPQGPTSKDAAGLWNLYRLCGPVSYGIEFKAQAASKIRYYPARLNDAQEPDPDVPPQVQAVFDEFSEGFDGGLSEAVGTMVTHWEVIGEMAVVNAGDDWSVWSTTEWAAAKRTWDTSTRHRDAVGKLGSDDFAFRVWNPDPELRHKAWSSVRAAALDIEQYLALREMVESTIWSAMFAGILGVPRSVLSGEPDAEMPNLDQVTANVIRSIEQVASGRNAGARLTPTVLEGLAEGDEIQFTDLARNIPEQTLLLLENALRRIATALDLPAEVLLGMGDINHWGQWFVDESARVNHVDPTVLAILRSIDTGYFHPMLEEVGVDNARDYVVWRDFSDLTARQLTVEQAIAMYEVGAIGGAAIRRIADLTDEDAPEPGESPSPNGEVVDGLTERRDPPVAAAVDRGIGRTLAQLDRDTYVALFELVEAETARAVEKAANRLRSALRHTPLAASVDGLEGAAVLAALADDLQAAGQDIDDIIPPSSWDRLRSRARTILTSAVGAARRLFNPDAAEFDAQVDAAVDYLTNSADAATRRLLDPETSSSEVVVDAFDVWATITYAAGGDPVTNQGAYRGITQSAVTWAEDAGYQIEQRVWNVGNPADPFEPHQHLAGVVFDSWEDPRLANGGTFPSSAFYYPGDHQGCLCATEAVFIEPEPVESEV